MKKRILSIVLVLCMVLSFVPITVFAAGGDKTVSLGTDVIKNPTAPTASTDTWKGSYVYFGTYGGNPVKYRVLDKNTTVFGGTTMLLDCDSILWAGRNPSSAFDDNSNDWANSNIRTYLNGTFLTSNFSTAEQNAIASSTKSAEYSTDGNGWIGTLSYASLSNDKIFFLDAKEATNTSYGYSNNAGSAANREKTGGNAVWWLRSAYTFDANYAGMVYPGGGLGKGVLGKYVGVSPALNINLSSVLFTSAAEGGKADTAVDGDLTAVSDYTGSEWKLTLLDSSRDSFSISGATVNNGTIRFSYSGAQTGTNEYISAVVVESGTITHYGRIFQLDGTTYGANGTASLSLPAGVTLSENTKLYVFNEQYNGDYQTDYASALKVVLPQETTPNATFTATGDNDGTLSNVDTSMKYSVDGGTTWNAVTGTTMDISSVTAEKDVKVYKPGNGTTTVDSEVQTIDVTQAVQPTGVDKADCTTSQQNDGQITGVDTTMEYRLSGTSGWTAVTVNPVTGLGSGSYEVRVKASGTVLASGTVIVTIGAHTCVAQGDWQHDGTGHWKLCACGAKIEEAAHSGDTASYFEKAACDYCHTEYGNLLTDTTAPTGEIAVGTNKWNSFLNTITFGLFFKDTQSVTITATDDSYDHAGFDDDKAVKVEYYLYSGDTALTKEDLASKEFTIYDGGFNINPDNKYVIYARLTDHAGNVTYISSEGVVLDASAPVISGIENGKTYCEAQTVTVDEKYLDSVTVNGKKVSLDENGKFILNPAEGTQTIAATDKAGNASAEITVTVNDRHTAGNDDGDCSTPVYCIYHPKVIVIAAKSHDFSGDWYNDATGHWHVCQNSGCKVSETKEAHSGTDDGDCTTAVICKCGYTITAAKSHDFSGKWYNDGKEHWHVCQNSGCNVNGPKESHSGKDDGDCTTAVVCECGYTITAAKSHDFSGEWHNDGKEHWHVCQNSGCKVNETKEAHTPGEAVKENDVAPTCTEDGSYDEVVCCKTCERELSRKTVTVSATGHKWGKWYVARSATSHVEGLMRCDCENCGEYKLRVIPKLSSPADKEEESNPNTGAPVSSEKLVSAISAIAVLAGAAYAVEKFRKS